MGDYVDIEGEVELRKALAEVVRERDEIKADYHNIIRKANTAEWERDEARDVAKWLLYDSGSYEGDPYALELKYDWMQRGG